MSPSFSPKRAILLRFLASLLIVGPICEEVAGQDFSRRLATADRFFTDGIFPEDLSVLLDPTFDGAIKGLVGYRLAVEVTYDSNVNLSATNERDDLYFTINPSIFYSSDPEGGARHSFSAYYSPELEFFRDSTAIKGSSGYYNHNGGFSYRFQGGRTSISAFLNLAQATGSDRFTGGFSEGSVFSYGASVNYQLAPRTMAYGSLSSSFSNYETTGLQGGDYVSANIGATWAATGKLSFGPSVNARWWDSDYTGRATRLVLNFNGSYVATELIRLSASIGVQGSRYSKNGGGTESGLTGSLDFVYQVSPIWTWSGSISNANIPSPTNFGYAIDDWLLETSLSRSLDVGSISATASYSMSDSEFVGVAATPGIQDRNFYKLELNYSRPFFSERISCSSSLSYLGSTGATDWTKWIASISWGASF